MFIRLIKRDGKYVIADWTKFETVQQAEAAPRWFGGECYIISDIIIDDFLTIFNEEESGGGGFGIVSLHQGEPDSL